MGLKATIYGYLRVPVDAPDTDVCRMERDLRSFAEAEDFSFATIFHEHVPGSHGAFLELTHELRRADAHDVVVPSLDHLSTHPLVRELMLNHLEQGVGAQIWTVERDIGRT